MSRLNGDVKVRLKKVEQLIQRRNELMINNVEWAQFGTDLGLKVHYQTLRRMENGMTLPRFSTLRRLEEILDHVEGARDRKRKQSRRARTGIDAGRAR